MPDNLFFKPKWSQKSVSTILTFLFFYLMIWLFYPAQAKSAYDSDFTNKRPLWQCQEKICAQSESLAGKNSNRRYITQPLIVNGEDEFQMQIGSTLQMDYHYYEEDCREDNRFDIRRAKLSIFGQINRLVHYRMEVEFQGNDPKLEDAFGELRLHQRFIFRFGQFKEPFSLEWQTQDKAIFFVERSIGYYLTPNRDVGIMVYGSLLHDRIHYSTGIFNVDGIDGSSRGSESDDPEWAARLVITPLIKAPWPWLRSIHIGGSATHAHIDLANVNLEVKSTGMVGTNRTIYKLNANTKFGVLRGVHQRRRKAFAAAWCWGPIALQGDYVNFRFTDLAPVGISPQDAEFSSWYGSAIFFITGESPEFKDGTLQPVIPKKDFDQTLKSIGALGIAIRLEHFSGDETWIMQNAFASVKKADAFSIALNWIITPMFRLILDYTDTNLSDPVRVRVDPKDGSIDYIEEEHVITSRLYINF